MLAARAPAPTGDLTLDAAAPVIEAAVAGVTLRLRVDPGQWQVIELDPAAARRLPLMFEDGHDVEVGTKLLRGRVAAAELRIDGVKRPVTVASHEGAAAMAGADGVIGPELLPYATIRWRRADAPDATVSVTLPLSYDDDTGFAAADRASGLSLHFAPDLPTSYATAAAGSRLARRFGGRFDGVASPVAAPFGQARPARPLRFAAPPVIGGFRFAMLPVRIDDYRGDNPLPADPIAPGEIVVAHRIAPQPARSWVTIAADRLSRCAEIVYAALPRTLMLRCAFDAP